MFKRIVAILMGIVISSSICMPAYAKELNSVACGTETVMNTAFGLEEVYDLSVVNRMVGRCGAATQTGAKGIAFEVLYTDLKNFENTFTSFEKKLTTQFTKCANAKTVDLVTLDKNGKIVERIQCKNTPSSTATKQVVDAVKSGKYTSTQLVGTTEAAEAFNKKAAAEGISKVMKDSHIPEAATIKIADKALGEISVASQVLKNAAKSAGCGAAFAGGIALIESAINGDDVYETSGNVVTESAIGAASMGLGSAVSCTVAEALNAVAMGSAVAYVTPIVICVGTTIIITYILEGIADEHEIRNVIAKYAKQGYEAVCEGFEEVKIFVSDLEIKNHISQFGYSIEDASAKGWEKACTGVGNAWQNTKKFSTKTWKNIKNSVSHLFSKDEIRVASTKDM